jgi:hypothetical protein
MSPRIVRLVLLTINDVFHRDAGLFYRVFLLVLLVFFQLLQLDLGVA